MYNVNCCNHELYLNLKCIRNFLKFVCKINFHRSSSFETNERLRNEINRVEDKIVTQKNERIKRQRVARLFL